MGNNDTAWSKALQSNSIVSSLVDESAYRPIAPGSPGLCFHKALDNPEVIQDYNHSL